MKKVNLFFLLFFLAGNIINAAVLPQPFAASNIAIINAPKAGAATVTELANAILLALQTNETDQLNGYLLTDAEINLLKKQGSEDMKAILENQTVTDLKTSFQADLKNLIQEGVGKTLNWTNMQVAETKVGNTTTKNRVLRPVELMLQAKDNQMVNITFETINLNNRYYFFRGIKLKS